MLSTCLIVLVVVAVNITKSRITLGEGDKGQKSAFRNYVTVVLLEFYEYTERELYFDLCRMLDSSQDSCYGDRYQEVHRRVH